LLDADGEEGLEKFALEAAGVFSAEEGIEGELLGEGAAALADVAVQNIADHGAGNPDGIDAVMGVEAGVFASEEGFYEGIGDVFEVDDDAVFAGETGVEFAVNVVDGGALGDVIDLLEIEGGGPDAVDDGNDAGDEEEGDGNGDPESPGDSDAFFGLPGGSFFGHGGIFG